MKWVETTTLVLHVLLSIGIVGLVLLQRGKGAEAGAGFGAGASGTVFGARGSSSFLSRSTAVMAGLFFITSLALAYLGGRPAAQSSVMDAAPAKIETSITNEAQPRQAEPPATTPPALPQSPESSPVEAPSTK